MCILCRHELRHRDPSSLTLGILGVGMIGKRSESSAVEMLALGFRVQVLVVTFQILNALFGIVCLEEVIIHHVS